jgi:DNA-directed RNA polymerase specialized sigma subunit
MMMLSDAARRREFDRLRKVRAEALHHARMSRKLAEKRRLMMHKLIEQGCTQSEIARELGVSRQAVQQMLM